MTIKSVLKKVLEDAREHVVCEGRDWRWIDWRWIDWRWIDWSWIGVFVSCCGGEADEQHCLAGGFELLGAFESFLVFLLPLQLAFLLA